MHSDSASDAAMSPVFQLTYQMTSHSYDELVALYGACSHGTPTWKREKERFVDVLVGIRDLWPR